MNLYEENDETSDVSYVNFNQDYSSLAVATKNSFKLFDLTDVDNLDVIHENSMKDIRIVERLFASNFFAVVTISAPRKLRVCHFKKGNELCNYSYSNTILSVKLNRARLVVCLKESLYIHNIKDMKVLHIIRDTPPNPQGLCVLSVHTLSMYLAYPGSSTIGEVQIFDVHNLQAKSMIPAHDNPLAAMAFNSNGRILATASVRGTVIRVFQTDDGAKLYEFRRGLARCVNILSLSFCDSSTYLCASSNTETVHIFKLDEFKDVKPTEESQSWMSYLGKTFLQTATYFPTQVADMLHHGRSFASIHLPFSGLKTICSLVYIKKVPKVVVAASNGLVYVYNMDPVEGGDCNLYKTHKIFDTEEDIIEKEASSDSISTEANASTEAQSENSHQPNQTGSASYASVLRGTESSTAQGV